MISTIAEKIYNAKISRWGLSLGVRIPAEIVKKINFTNKEEIIIIPLKNGFQVQKVNSESAYDYVI